jgi:Cu2+-exporting ATPase
MTAAALAAVCVHCSLPIPNGRGGTYCCTGCEIVAGAIAIADLPSSRAYTELDDPAFQNLHVTRDPSGTAHVALYLEDLRCTACVWLVEGTPRSVPGVTEVRVDLGRSRADVSWDPASASLAQIAHHLDRIQGTQTNGIVTGLPAPAKDRRRCYTNGTA